MSARAALGAFAARRIRDLPPARRLRVQLAASELAREAAGRDIGVLDAGCEVGLLSIRLARRHPGWRISAIDINEDSLAVARRRAAEENAANISFARVDLTRDAPETGFDAVAAIECLAEIPDDYAALRFMAASLRPGGLLLVHVPERNWRPVLAGSPAAWKGEQRHGYTRDEIVARVRAAGLEVLGVRPTTHAAVHLVQELRERLKRRSRKVQLLLYPLVVASVALERAGWRPGAARALMVSARRPAAAASAPTGPEEARRSGPST
jgi:SAM-dependent methyltransferase